MKQAYTLGDFRLHRGEDKPSSNPALAVLDAIADKQCSLSQFRTWDQHRMAAARSFKIVFYVWTLGEAAAQKFAGGDMNARLSQLYLDQVKQWAQELEQHGFIDTPDRQQIEHQAYAIWEISARSLYQRVE